MVPFEIVLVGFTHKLAITKQVNKQTTQTTRPQTHLHSQHYCSHFSTLLERERAVHISVSLVWISFSTSGSPSKFS